MTQEPNPYAPPARSEDAAVVAEPAWPSGLGAGDLWLARLYLGAALVFSTVGGVAAGLLRRILLEPFAHPGVWTYARSFDLHSLAMASGVAVPALGCGVGALVVPAAMGTRSELTAKVAWAGWAVWGAGVVGLVAGRPASRSLWASAVALGIGLMAVHLVAVCALGFLRGSTRSALRGVLFTMGLGLVAWACVERALLAGSDDLSVAGQGGIITSMFPDADVVTFVSWPNLLLAMVLGVHLFVRRRDHDASARGSLIPLVYVVAGILPAALLYLASSALVRSAPIDLALHDTYFDVGRLHAGASLAVFGMLAALHGWFEDLVGRTYRPGLALAACLTIALGMHATTVRMMQLGAQGMPRRYATYVDVFQSLHHDVGIAMAVTAAGAGIAIVAMVAGKRLVSGSRA